MPTLRRRRYLLISRIEIIARGYRRGHAVGTWAAVGATAAAREALALAGLEAGRAAIDLRLRSGDE